MIERLAGIIGPAPSEVAVGLGDDAAAWRPSPQTLTVATTDALVEGVHFRLSTTEWRDLGWKALAENISDVAAMGCHPRYAVIALGLPGDRLVEEVEALYHGIVECAAAYDCHVVGGDVVRAPCVLISVTVLGESLPDAGGEPLILRRSAAQPGDALAVTGPLGGSAAGLRLLEEGLAPTATLSLWERGAEEDDALRTHRRPRPRVTAGLALVEAGVRCAIDVSDGLVADVGHICQQSGVDAEIDAALVPVDPAGAAHFPTAALQLALEGGEDYELVCAAPPEVITQAGRILAERGEPPLTVIGEVVPRAGEAPAVRVRSAGGQLISAGHGGYQHFGRA